MASVPIALGRSRLSSSHGYGMQSARLGTAVPNPCKEEEPGFELVFLGLSLSRAHCVASVPIALGRSRLSSSHGYGMQSARTMIQAPPAHQRQLGRVPVSARYPHYQYKRFPPAKLVPGRAYRDSWLVSRRAHPCRARPRPCSPPATLTVPPAVLAPLRPPPAVSATAVLSPGRARPRPCLP